MVPSTTFLYISVLLLFFLVSSATDAFVIHLPSGLPSSLVSPNSLAQYPSYSKQNSRLLAIVDEVSDEMKKAMKAKDTTRLATIRLIRSAFANAQIDLKVEKLSDDQALDVLRKMAKMRKESIAMYEKGGAHDRAAAEQAELEIMETWLPSLADEEQTRIWVQEAIQQAGGDNVGKVMGALMKAHKGEVDGAVAQKVVKEELAKL